MKKCLIIHGWDGNNGSNWFPWLKKELENSDYKVFLPDLPNTNNPNYYEQINFVNKKYSELGEGDIVVGHSLGCKTALHFIEKNQLKGLKVILVAPVYPGLAEDLGKKVYGDAYENISEYFNKKNDFKKLGNKYIVFLSNDDPYIDSIKAKNYFKQLENVNFIDFENMGHFNEGSGIYELNELLEYLNKHE